MASLQGAREGKAVCRRVRTPVTRKRDVAVKSRTIPKSNYFSLKKKPKNPE